MSRIFGEVRQNGYVVHDIETAMRHWTETMDADLERLERAGFEIGQSGCIGNGGRFVYYDTAGPPGSVIELSEIDGGKGRFFEHVRDAARGWDGSDPIRRI